MTKSILIVGYGPGISSAVAERFGREGFQVGLVGRNQEKLDAGVRALEAKGIRAGAFSANAGDPQAVRGAVRRARETLGPIAVLEWTAYASAAGDLLTADTTSVREALDVATVGLLAAVQESLPDLRSQQGAVLITNGGVALFDPDVDAFAISLNEMGLAVANAAKHKLVGLLSQKLRPEGIYVGEVMVHAFVKGTPFDKGNATVDPVTVANKYWELYTTRTQVTVRIG